MSFDSHLVVSLVDATAIMSPGGYYRTDPGFFRCHLASVLATRCSKITSNNARCNVPEELDETWAHLRHLGRRREQLITAETASMHRIREFLPVAWPTVMETCAHPLKSVSWLAAMQVVTQRCGGQPARLAGMGWQAFAVLARGAVTGWGGTRAWGAIIGRVFDALTDTEGAVEAGR